MNRDIAKQWVAKLRDPELKQTTGQLYDGKDGYCCLGVLCLVVGHKVSIVNNDGWCHVSDIEGTFKVLPPKICAKAEMATNNGRPKGWLHTQINGRYYEHLASANDEGVPFPKIADYIEQNWEQL